MAVEPRLIDKNVLVYAYDLSEKIKHSLARGILDQIWDDGGGVVTLQNLSEFFVAVTKKVQNPISASTARTILSDIVRSNRWLIIDRQAETLFRAIDLVESLRTPIGTGSLQRVCWSTV